MARYEVVVLAGLVCLTGCVGLFGDGEAGSKDGQGSGIGPDGEQIPLECSLGIPQAGAEEIYRLTPEEYTNSVRVLLGNESLDPSIDEDEESIATLSGVRKWMDAADSMVPLSTGWMSSYVSCDLTDEACASAFYEAFAERAFRRPLNDDDKAWLTQVWAALPGDATLAERLKAMVELVLQAPQFLYIYSEGTLIKDSPHGLHSLDGYERAQRLSYFLWDSLPDDELLRAAGAGELDEAAGMRVQAERMLSDDRARPVLGSFLADWLQLDGGVAIPGLEQAPKDASLFPDFDASLRAAMRKEIEAFMEYVMFEKDGSLEALFTDTRAYVNGPLATFYGVKDGPTGADEWAWVDLDPKQRAGMLTRAGFLAVHAGLSATSPIRRGVYMLRKILCYDVAPPPPNVDNSPVEVTDLEDDGDGVISVREETTRRTSGGTCGTCHKEINGLGFAFEHYNAVGQWQETETGTGATLDTTATLTHAGPEIDGPIDGAIELSSKMAGSPSVATCATTAWFEVALRRSPVPLDDCSIESIAQKAGDSQSIRELLLAMVESDAFLNVNHGVEEK